MIATVLRDHLGSVEVTVGLSASDSAPDLVVLGPGMDRRRRQRLKEGLARGVQLFWPDWGSEARAGDGPVEAAVRQLLSEIRLRLRLPAEPDGEADPKGSESTETFRQRLVGLLREGMTYKEISGVVHLAESTVKWHACRLFKEHEVKNRRELVRVASRNGLRPPPPEVRGRPRAPGGGARGRVTRKR